MAATYFVLSGAAKTGIERVPQSIAKKGESQDDQTDAKRRD